MSDDLKLDWNLIRSFLAVARGGSLSAAARALQSTQPTVGRHINELESGLDVILFQRGRDGFALTEKGLTLYERAEPMEDSATAFIRLAAGSANKIAGTVRITASEVVAAFVLPQILAELAIAEPDIEIELVGSNLLGNLLARDADIAVRMVRPVQNDLVVRHVAELPLAVCASKSYLDRYGRPRAPNDLTQHRLIGWDRSDEIIKGFVQFGVAVDRHAFHFRCDNQIVLWEAVKAGLGIGFAQKPLVVRNADVEQVLHALPLPSLPMWLTIHEDLRTSARVRRVLDFLYPALKRYAAFEGDAS
jgi:DNA-binding transcriptional LysR family regulator